MKLYSVVLFVVIFNLAVGSLLMFIKSGVFLDSANYDYIAGKLGTYETTYTTVQDAANDFQAKFTQLQGDLSSGNVLGLIYDALTLAVTCIADLFIFFITALGTVPNMILTVMGTDQVMANMISTILAVLMGVTLFQLLTSRWFTFGE